MITIPVGIDLDGKLLSPVGGLANRKLILFGQASLLGWPPSSRQVGRIFLSSTAPPLRICCVEEPGRDSEILTPITICMLVPSREQNDTRLGCTCTQRVGNY